MNRRWVVVLLAIILSAWPRMAAAQPAKHVIIISIDGLHQDDLTDPALRDHIPTILSMAASGVSYTNAATTFPSDSVPGALAYLTGAGPVTTGIYFDDTYCRSFLEPGSPRNGSLGAEMHLGEDIDKNEALIDGGGDAGLASLDPAKFPVDPSRSFAPVYPHDYLKVNTIFEIAHAAGMRTSIIDKHSAYELAAGPSGKGLDDLYAPEAHAKAALIDGKLVDASTAPPGTRLKAVNKTVPLMTASDDLRLAALRREIHGQDSRGTGPAAVPGLICINFQAINVAQRNPEGGIEVVDGKEFPSAKLLLAMKDTDDAIGIIVQDLKTAGLWDQTLIVLTAKHGQSPRVGSGKMIPESAILAPLQSAGIPVASTTIDDVELIWLKDSGRAAAAAKALTALRDGNANPGIERVLWGDSLRAANLTGAADRTPDLLVILKPGVLISDKPTRAKHGGNCPDDVHIPLILAGGAIDSARRGASVADNVKTTQIAVTALKAMGLDPAALQGAKIEHTPALPASGF